MITYPYPLEFREGAMLVTTDLLVKGRNPFSWDEQPQHTNIYGIVYHLIVYPFAKLFNTGAVVHRSVSAVFIIASCFIIFLVLRRKKVPVYYIFPAVLLLYAFFLFPGTTTPFSGPHSLGLFLFLGSIFIPWLKKYSLMSLVVSVILGILGFYSKAYFVLGLPFLTIYIFLFVSKKKGVLFGATWTGLLFLSILCVKQILECYFANTFFINLNGAQNSLSHCLKQFHFFFQKNRELFAVLALGVLIQVISKFKSLKGFNIIPKANFNDFKKPFFDRQVDLNLFCLICSTLLIYFKLGRHGGSWMGYLFQLMTPFFIILVFSSLKKDMWRFITLPMIGISIITVLSSHLEVNPEESLKNWKTVREIVSKYKNIYNSPAIVSLLVEQDKEIYDSGLTECFHLGEAKGSFLKSIFLKKDRVAEKTQEYNQNIYDQIVHKKFDLLLVTKNWFVRAPVEETRKNYKYLGSIDVIMPYFPQVWKLGIWLPRK